MENRYLNRSFGGVTTTTNVYLFFDHEFDYKKVEFWKDDNLTRKIYRAAKDNSDLQSIIDWYNKNQPTYSQNESHFGRYMSEIAKEMKQLFFSFNTNHNTKKYWDFIKENNGFEPADLKADGCGNYMIKLVIPPITLREIYKGVEKTQEWADKQSAEMNRKIKETQEQDKQKQDNEYDEGMEM